MKHKPAIPPGGAYAGVSELHPVIHYQDLPTTVRNAAIAAEACCHGVFLIHMDGRDHLLDDAVLAVRKEFPRLQIGVNRLGTEPVAALRMNLAIGADSTWVDACGIRSSGVSELGVRLSTQLAESRRAHPSHQLFGSVAFKYQPEDLDPPLAAVNARGAGFIPTTSGDATGSAPTAEKIVRISQALEEKVLAVASGVTPENAARFVPHVRYFLVSTGISSTFYQFNASRVRALAEILRNGGR